MRIYLNQRLKCLWIVLLHKKKKKTVLHKESSKRFLNSQSSFVIRCPARRLGLKLKSLEIVKIFIHVFSCLSSQLLFLI